MDQSEDKRSPQEPPPEADVGAFGIDPGFSKKASRKQGKKGLRVALKRLSTIQTVGIAIAIAAMSVGTAYFALVKPQQPEPTAPPVTITLPSTILEPAPVTTGITPTPKETPTHSKPIDQIVRWTFKTRPGDRLRKPVSGNGHVYVAGDHSVYSIARAGDLRWEFTVPDNGKPTSPTVNTDTNVIVASNEGIVYSLNGWGDIVWEFDTKGTVIGQPAVSSKGYLVVGSEDLVCINQWGDEYWTFSPEDTRFTNANPVMANNILVTGANERCDGVLFALSYKGELLWELDLELHFEAIPTVDKQGTIYVYSNKTQIMHSVSPTGKILWSKNIRGNQRSCISLMPDGSLVAAGFDSMITCFTPDGTVLWSTRAVSSQNHGPFIGSDGLIYVSGNHSMLVLNPDGTILVKIKLPRNPLGGMSQGLGGSVYASLSSGELILLKLPQ